MTRCGRCKELFGGVSAFDAHRVGKHAYLWSPDREDGRRCLPPEEMRAKGFTRNARGEWSLAGPLARARLLRLRQVATDLGRSSGGAA